MLINKKNWQTIWFNQSTNKVEVIDQRKLPHNFSIKKINCSDDAVFAIKEMVVRGAPLIGVMGAYGLMLGLEEDPSDINLECCYEKLLSTRPTAVNLKWALDRVFKKVVDIEKNTRAAVAKKECFDIEKEDIKMCSSIGDHGCINSRNL